MMKLSIALAALGLAVLLLSFAPAPAPANNAATTAGNAATAPQAADVAYGKALFSAKGCVSCHLLAAVPNSGTYGAGPNLSHYQVNPDFLRKWLKAPSAVRPGTQMPTLGLNDQEIEALIAFLSASTRP